MITLFQLWSVFSSDIASLISRSNKSKQSCPRMPPAVKRFHSGCVVPSDIDSDCHFSTDPKPYLSTPCKSHPKPISELIIPEYSCLFLVAGHYPNSRDFNGDCVDGRKSFVSKCNSMLGVLSREDSLKSGDHCSSLFQWCSKTSNKGRRTYFWTWRAENH